MRLAKLLAAAGLQQPVSEDIRVTGFAIDHRQVAPGTVFGAFRGAQVNGEDYIPAAIAAGAVAIVARPEAQVAGAVHIADALIHFARPLGYKTYLVDPRTAFATRERFPHVDEIYYEWADEALPKIGLNSETAVVVITHDPKLDDPALKLALPSPAFYVGALGSPKTHAQRVARLLGEGMPQDQLDRLHAPIGLDLGGRTPAEIALSIIAEVVAVHNDVALGDRLPVSGL